MPKTGFNDHSIGSPNKPHGDVRSVEGPCAFEPVVVHASGIKAIIEGLRLADIKCELHTGRGDE